MKKLVVIALLHLIVLLPSYAQKPAEDFSGEMVDFIQLVAKTTGKTIVYDTSVKGRKVDILNMKYDTPEQLFALFFSVMEYNNYIIETIGMDERPIYKIKRNILGPWTPTPVLADEKELDAIANSDQFVSLVMPLKHVSSRVMQTTLRALRIVNPQAGNLAGLDEPNMILITDYAANVKRVCEIAKKIDTPNLQNMPMIAKFSIEGKTVYLPKVDKDIIAKISMQHNLALTITTESGEVLSHLDPNKYFDLWLTPYLKQEGPIKLKFEIEALISSVSQMAIHVEAVPDDKEKKSRGLWSFSVDRFLPAGKKIEFTVVFQ